MCVCSSRDFLRGRINDSPHPFKRMLAVLRSTLTKDLKFVVCPSSVLTFLLTLTNSMVLGEHFCTQTPARFPNPDPNFPSTKYPRAAPPLSPRQPACAISSSSKSAKSGWSNFSKAPKSPSTAATSVEAEPGEAQVLKKLTLSTGEGPTGTGTGTGKVARVVYVTEQVSHHPAVSAYSATYPKRSLQLFGIDRI